VSRGELLKAFGRAVSPTTGDEVPSDRLCEITVIKPGLRLFIRANFKMRSGRVPTYSRLCPTAEFAVFGDESRDRLKTSEEACKQLSRQAKDVSDWRSFVSLATL
jgi:hypothetical protein